MCYELMVHLTLTFGLERKLSTTRNCWLNYDAISHSNLNNSLTFDLVSYFRIFQYF